jgi:glucokinase
VILAADVGGTKTHLALYQPHASPRAPLAERKLPSRGHRSFEALVGEFLSQVGDAPIERATIGVAGPVVDLRADTTNLPWDVSGPILSERLGGADVELLNDLVATAWGLDTLAGDDVRTLQAGDAIRGNRALIAAGTGLGEALLVWHDGHWHPTASEGGHSDFAPRDALEDEFLVWLRGRFGRASYERVLSGPGLADLYRFLGETERGHASPSVLEQFADAQDPAAVVTEAALEGRCERAVLALDRFVSIYGAEAGNLALQGLALGGVFVAGGIAPRILSVLESGTFTRAFGDKGRLSSLVHRIPVSVVLRPETALWGAAARALSSDSQGEPT